MHGNPARVPFSLNRFEYFCDEHDFGVRQLCCRFLQPRQSPRVLLRARARLPRRPPPQPPHRSSKKQYRQDQSPIRRCNSDIAKHHDVSNRYEQRRNKIMKKPRFISSPLVSRALFFLLYIFASLLRYFFSSSQFPGRYCARLVSVSHKITSVTRAPAGKSFNPRVTSS